MAEYPEGFIPITRPEAAAYPEGFVPVTAAPAGPALDVARGTPPGQSGVIGPVDTRTAATKTYEAIAEPVKRGLSGALGAILNPILETAALPIAGNPRAANPPEVGASLGEKAAGLGVPPNLTSAGITGALYAAGPLGPLARTAAAMGAAGLGAYAEDHPLVPEMLKTGATVGSLEALGKVLPWISKSMPGGKQAINAEDVAKLSEAMGNAAAPLAGAPKDAKGLQDFILSGEAQKRLGARMQLTSDAIDQALGPTTLIKVPSLGTDANPDGLMTFGNAWKEIGKLGQQGYGGAKSSVLGRDVRGLDPREQWANATEDVSKALQEVDPTGGLKGRWDAAKDIYGAGMSVVGKLLAYGGPRAFQTYPSDVILNTPYVQGRMSQNREELARKIPNWDELLSALRLSPETLGLADRPASGLGAMSDTLKMLLNRKGGSAAWWTSPITTAFPNASGTYVGGNPMKIPPEIQVLADILGQQAAQRMTSGQPVKVGPMPMQ